ncbi:VIP36-like protein isoform X1 [Phyllopteryx taeniolatus]|uniref:VIP36-like protein isoform X1 n=2 Tax=Phyllopteryx taeniolatus TaxID=161469 RepID=UPI002AD32157|nr:VIP36-like protein isoform X1 [Phyllopteryx taeniolatus]
MYSMFTVKNIRELTCLLAQICTLSLSMTEAQDFMEDFLKREYSLVTPYRGLGLSSSSLWDLKGTAIVTVDHVRLTADQPGRQGAVWSRIPLLLRDWEFKVHFKIHGQSKKKMNGDGLAIWLTKERMQEGPVFGSRNEFTGLGVFVDTYPNTGNYDRVFPYVSVMLGNGTLSYDHNKDGHPTELGGCSTKARNARQDTFLLIKYTKNRLTVMIDVDGKQIWKNCVDIPGLHLPKGYYLGASSATGELSDNHDIISMKLYELTVKRDPEEELLIPRVDHGMGPFQVEIEEEQMSGVQLFFTLLFTILGLGVLAVVGLIVYGRWKQNKRKRFY